MKSVVIFAGVNGSGKSTIIRNILERFGALDYSNSTAGSLGQFFNNPPGILFLGDYSGKRVLPGPDAWTRKKTFEKMFMVNPEHVDILVVEGQRFCSGENLRKLKEFCVHANAKLDRKSVV